jgi:uncharacterized membrane protein
MSELVAVAYPDVYRAAEVCAELQRFMKELGEKLQPGTSALFVLFRKATWVKVRPHGAKHGGTVLHSSLSSEAEAKLQVWLTEGGEPRMAA